MKMFNDSHLEVKKFFKGTFFTHPYEAGWADEAIFFVMVEKIEGDPVLRRSCTTIARRYTLG